MCLCVCESRAQCARVCAPVYVCTRARVGVYARVRAYVRARAFACARVCARVRARAHAHVHVCACESELYVLAAMRCVSECGRDVGGEGIEEWCIQILLEQNS